MQKQLFDKILVILDIRINMIVSEYKIVVFILQQSIDFFLALKF